jgi:LysR family hydrogen peroxide-inducible transcriptional activator
MVHTHEDFRPELMHGVTEGDFDLAIIPQPVRDPRLSVEVLYHEPLLLVVGKDHPLATKPAITAQDLANESFVLLGHSSTLSAEIERFCGAHDFVPKLAHRCSQVSTVKALVALGPGISILPRIAILPNDKKSLVFRELSGRVPSREVLIVRHLQRYQTKGAEFFLQVLRMVVAELVAAEPGTASTPAPS